MSVLAHRVDGAGAPVLLLNGGLMTYLGWEEIARPLAASYRVIRCDLRGQLLSPGQAPSLAGQVDELVRLLDTLGVERTHVVGASFGGAVGIVFAATRPDRVSSLAAVTVAAGLPRDSDDETTRLLAAAAVAVTGGDRGAVFDAIVPTTFSEKWRTANAGLLAQRRKGISLLPDSYFEGLIGLMHSLDGLDLTPWLPSIACPVVAVAAEHDVVFPVARVREMAAAIGDAEVVVVPDTGHGMLVEQPAALVAALAAFLGRVDLSSRNREIRNR